MTRIPIAKYIIIRQMSRMSSLISSGVVLTVKESNTGPRKKKNVGRIAPVMAAKVHPM